MKTLGINHPVRIDKFLKDNIFFISKREGTSEKAVFISNQKNNPSISKFANYKDLLKNLIPFFIMYLKNL